MLGFIGTMLTDLGNGEHLPLIQSNRQVSCYKKPAVFPHAAANSRLGALCWSVT